MKKIDCLTKDVELLKKELVQHEPEHFGTKDIIFAFFGALLIGLTFVLKGLLINVSKVISWGHVYTIIISSIVFISLGIYFIGYTRVADKRKRKPGQFILKRLLAIYLITIIVSLYLTYIFGVNQLSESTGQTIKIVAILTMPCSLGATIADLFRKL